MIQHDVLQSLFQVRLDLANRVMDLSPGEDPAKKTQLQSLLRKRDQVVQTINAVIAAAFKDVFNPDLSKSLEQLETETAGLKGLASTFDTVNAVLGKVDSALGAVAKVLTTVAG